MTGNCARRTGNTGLEQDSFVNCRLTIGWWILKFLYLIFHGIVNIRLIKLSENLRCFVIAVSTRYSPIGGGCM